MHPANPPGHWYVVARRGDAGRSSPRRAGVPAEDILELNGLERAAQVKPGTLLFVLTGSRAGGGDLGAPPPP